MPSISLNASVRVISNQLSFLKFYLKFIAAEKVAGQEDFTVVLA